MEYGDTRRCTPEIKKAEVKKRRMKNPMFSEEKTGFKAQVTKQFIGIMVVIIIGVAVVIPVVINVTETASITGTAGTLVNLLPLFIAVALILVVVGLY